jgi:hypothetical protein
MFSSTTLSSSRRNVHRARPLGGSEHASAASLASAAPSKMRVLAEAGECFGVSTASNPSSTSCWTNSGDRHQAGVQRRSDPAVAPSFPCLTCISLQQDAGPGQRPRRVLATLDQAIQTLSLFHTELHDILLYGDLFRGHESAHESAPSLLRAADMKTRNLPTVPAVAAGSLPRVASDFLDEAERLTSIPIGTGPTSHTNRISTTMVASPFLRGTASDIELSAGGRQGGAKASTRDAHRGGRWGVQGNAAMCFTCPRDPDARNGYAAPVGPGIRRYAARRRAGKDRAVTPENPIRSFCRGDGAGCFAKSASRPSSMCPIPERSRAQSTP